MKKNVRKGILKAAEAALLLGMVGGSIGAAIGFSANSKKYEKSYDKMLNSDTVLEYVQDNLGDLNEKYTLGLLDYDVYKKEVNDLKKDAAQEIYGEEFEKVDQNIQKNKGLSYVFIGTMTLSGLAAVLEGVHIQENQSVAENIADKLSAEEIEKKENKINEKLRSLRDSKEYDEVRDVMKYEDNVIFKTFKDMCFVYKYDTSDLDIGNYEKFIDYGGWKRAWNGAWKYSQDFDKLYKLVKNEKPEFIGTEEEFVKEYNIESENEEGNCIEENPDETKDI